MGKRLSSLIFLGTIMMSIIADCRIADAGCERVARDCIEPGETRKIDGRDMYRECWRYKDAYRCKGYAKNNCAELDAEPFCEIIDTTCKEKVGDWCVAQQRDYKCQKEKTIIRKEKRYRAPTFQKKNIEERKRVKCGNEIECLDGKCFDMSYKANDEIGQAASSLAALKNMQGTQGIGIFKGEIESCTKKKPGNRLNCCSKMTGWAKDFFNKKCTEREVKLAKIKDEQCVEIKPPFCVGYLASFCIREKTNFCCYDSKLAREIQVQGRAQINKGWGSNKHPDCSGFTIEELQKIDFEKLDFSFLSKDIKKGVLWSKMGNMEKALEHTQNILENEAITIKADVNGVDDQKLYENKFNEVHNDPSAQKKPDGRDKTRDLKGEKEIIYNKDEYKGRDNDGL